MNKNYLQVSLQWEATSHLCAQADIEESLLILTIAPLVLFSKSVLNENNLVLFQVIIIIIIINIAIVVIKMIFKYLFMRHTASFLLNDPFEFYIIFLT